MNNVTRQRETERGVTSERGRQTSRVVGSLRCQTVVRHII